MPRVEPNRQKLMPLTATKLRPSTRRYLVWDTLQRGFALQVQPTGYRAYKLIYRFHNRSRWFHIGAADAIGLADARKLAAKLMLEVIQGKDPAAEKRATRSTGTFAELADRYVEEHAKRKNKSWQQADKLVRRNLLPAWGGLIASAITRSDVRTTMSKIDAPMTANQTLAAASAIFTWATKQELLSNNPCRGVERNATQSRERVLSDAEVPLFWQAFGAGVSRLTPAAPDATEKLAPVSRLTCGAGAASKQSTVPGTLVAGAALQVLLLTGQRPGEVTHMRYDQIVDGWWTLPGAPDAATGWPGTKNAQTHRVWLPQAVQDIIAGLKCGDDFVFGQSLDLAPTMRVICKQLSVPRATPHDLRRTHGSTITRLGFGRDAMNRIQNHKEGGIASVYDRYQYADENKRIMETVAAHLLALTQEKVAPNNVIAAKF